MIRKATVVDILKIQNLINKFASKDLMLSRSLNELYENLRDFWIYQLNERIVGCVALHISWEDIAEIKSLAVETKFQRRGIGSILVKTCLEEAKLLGCRKVFVLTYIPQYFKKFGFKTILHSKLPHKVWAECINCPKFPNCKETAMIKKI